MNVMPQILVGQPEDSAETQCDCACPDGGLAASMPLVPDGTQWQIVDGLHRTLLPQDHELFFDPLGFAHVLVLNASARTVLARFTSPHALSDVACDGIPLAVASATAVQCATFGLLRPVLVPAKSMRRR